MSIKQRSPNYPNWTLEESLNDIRAIYNVEGRNVFPVEIAAKHLGYKSLSGPARSRFASLRQYGLVEKRSKDGFVLTERALTLILRNQSSKEHMNAMVEAALEPELFKELFETMQSSSDNTIRHYLIVNKRFTNDGAKRFIEVFRATTNYAKYSNYNNFSRLELEVNEDNDTKFKAYKIPLPPRQEEDTTGRVIQLPLSPNKWVNLYGYFPVSEEEWQLMINVLNAHKPGLVKKAQAKETMKELEPEN